MFDRVLYKNEDEIFSTTKMSLLKVCYYMEQLTLIRRRHDEKVLLIHNM